MDINLLQYGNPCSEVVQIIAESSFLDLSFSELSKLSFPKNDSNIIKEELNQIAECLSHLHTNAELMRRYKAYDRSLFSYMMNLFFENDEDKTARYRETIKSIFDDVLPLVFKLKLHFQRPRPWQLAHHFKLKLFPLNSFSAMSPSFPSLHACLGYVINEVCGNKFPEWYKFFKESATDIAYSRMYMGLAFSSDLDAGILAAKKIIDNREFKIKYNL